MTVVVTVTPDGLKGTGMHVSLKVTGICGYDCKPAVSDGHLVGYTKGKCMAVGRDANGLVRVVG